MFGKKVVQDSVEENVLSKREGNKKKVLILSGAVALLLVGFVIGKASMSGEYENAKEVSKNTEKKFQIKNAELQDEVQRLQRIVVERGDKEKELANAFEAAISIKDATSVINNKIAAVSANAQRIKDSYISDNSGVRNLDSRVIRELISVVDNDTNKQLSVLGHAIKVLDEYQKGKVMMINRGKEEDTTSQVVATQKENVITKESNVKREADSIEPLDFNKSAY